jgi:uncharacterized protein (UPF0332 family)
MKSSDPEDLIRCRLEHAQIALDNAKFLLDGHRSPQSVINRAYYAMFYATLALLQKIGRAPSKHAGVISLFDSEFVRTGIFGREFSKDFHRAFELRQAADYKVTALPTRETAQELLNKAVHFVGAVSARLLPPATERGS